MNMLRPVIGLSLVVSLAAPASAGDLQEAVANAAQTQAPPPAASLPAAVAPSGHALLWTGAGVFAGGMATALVGFIRVNNGAYSQFGEATSRNKPLGAAGIAAAFAGGTLMFVANHRRAHVPSVSVTPAGVTASTQVSW